MQKLRTGKGQSPSRVVLGVALVGMVTASVAVVAPAVSPTPAQAAPVVSAPTTQFAVVRQISGIASPRAVAVDSTDDTVYVGSGSSSTIFVIDGRSGLLSAPISFGAGEVKSIAVNDADDTIYATLSTPAGLAIVSGTNPQDDSTVVSAADLGGVAVNVEDDSVYAAGTTGNNVQRFDGRTGAPLGSISAGSFASGVAVDSLDDSVYVANVTSDNVSIISGRGGPGGGTVSVGDILNNYMMIAVNESDDTVYVVNGFSNSVSVIDGRSATLTDDTVNVGSLPYGVAVDQRDDTVYVANRGSDSLSVIDGRTATLTDDTITFDSSSFPYGTAVDNAGPSSGVVYVSNEIAGNLSVVARVTPTIWPPAAPVGNVVTLTLDVPQVAYDVDNATVTTVYFDDTAVTPTAGAGDTWTVTVPPGTGTNVPVTVKLRGGLYASAGTFTFGTTTPTQPILDTAVGGNASIDIAWTEIFDGGTPVTTVYYAINGYTRRSLGTLVSPATITADSSGAPLAPGTSYTVRIQLENADGYSYWSNVLTATTNSNPTPPTPPVTYPPGPPTDVVAVAGDANASVAWSAPSDSGSFPISDYEVKASPGGAACLVKVPATSCIVDDLTNGTAYTFTVRALNGAGWGASSQPSNAVTPVKPTPPVDKTIMITGSRTEFNGRSGVTASGITTGLVGATVQARVHLAGEEEYTNGSRRKVGDDGAFRWKRIAGKKVYVYFQTEDREVRSNRIVIPVA